MANNKSFKIANFNLTLYKVQHLIKFETNILFAVFCLSISWVFSARSLKDAPVCCETAKCTQFDLSLSTEPDRWKGQTFVIKDCTWRQRASEQKQLQPHWHFSPAKQHTQIKWTKHTFHWGSQEKFQNIHTNHFVLPQFTSWSHWHPVTRKHHCGHNHDTSTTIFLKTNNFAAHLHNTTVKASFLDLHVHQFYSPEKTEKNPTSHDSAWFSIFLQPSHPQVTKERPSQQKRCGIHSVAIHDIAVYVTNLVGTSMSKGSVPPCRKITL